MSPDSIKTADRDRRNAPAASSRGGSHGPAESSTAPAESPAIPQGAGEGAPIEADDKPIGEKVRHAIFGKPRDPSDRSLFHRLSLVAFLAWVGLGADGLSSASYGPAEAFLALGEHAYLAVGLAILTPLTVLIIATAYSRIIEAFPQGGGGYVVSTKLLGPGAGVLSGCALLVDYVLTITVSIAAAGDAMFSLLPMHWLPWKVPFEVVIILLGIGLNIRGVKESVQPLVPIFLLFLVTHAVLILGGIAMNMGGVGETTSRLTSEFNKGAATLGVGGMLLLLLRAYSLGAGTYTGIEAVSNGLNIMREPRVQTAKRTMTYMSISLAVTAAGLILCFLLVGVAEEHGKTLNAVLAENVVQGFAWGHTFVWLTLASEAAILVVAAQTGFIGGPRVLANMAVDGWVPRRFSGLSDRLTTHNGIVLMGTAALAALLLAQGHVRTLVIMYSINVFITFSLSMAAMVRDSFQCARKKRPRARRDLALFTVGLAMCLVILLGTSIIKFGEGGWVTLAVTGGLVAVCVVIRGHYRGVSSRVQQLQRQLQLPDRARAAKPPAFDPAKPTAAVLVGGYSGLGMHTTLMALSSFGGYFKNIVFISVGVVDSGVFKGQAEMDALRKKTVEDMQKYVDLANRLGVPAQYRCDIGIDPVDELEELCKQVQREFPKVSFFAGQLSFQQERWFDRILHNQTAYSLQRRLHWAGIPVLILPIRVK